jgi:hypothetical protein
MTYSSGGLIQATDFNGFVSTSTANLNATWGSSGFVNYGYGQANVPTVSAGGVVSATDWANLVNKLSVVGAHTGVTITSRTAPVAGNIIAVLANVATDLTNIFTSRANAASSGSTISPATGTWWQATNTPNSAWTITTTHTITFANTNAAAFFFNSGGLIKWQAQKTSTGTVNDTDWNNIVGLTGNIYLSGANTAHSINGTAYTGITKSGGTGTPTTLATTTGFYNLTTTPTTVYDQFSATAPYTGDHIRIQMNTNSNTAPTTLTVTTAWINAATAGPGSTEVITGGVAGVGPTTVVNYVAPETTNLGNTWGAITIAATTAQT